jgi:hypothetical protein
MKSGFRVERYEINNDSLIMKKDKMRVELTVVYTIPPVSA